MLLKCTYLQQADLSFLHDSFLVSDEWHWLNWSQQQRRVGRRWSISETITKTSIVHWLLLHHFFTIPGKSSQESYDSFLFCFDSSYSSSFKLPKCLTNLSIMCNSDMIAEQITNQFWGDITLRTRYWISLESQVFLKISEMMILYFLICAIGFQNVFSCHQKWTRQSFHSSGSSWTPARATCWLNLLGGLTQRQRQRRKGKTLGGLSCPDYLHFYTNSCHGVIENVFSWQECGKTTQASHYLFLAGLALDEGNTAQ